MRRRQLPDAQGRINAQEGREQRSSLRAKAAIPRKKMISRSGVESQKAARTGHVAATRSADALTLTVQEARAVASTLASSRHHNKGNRI
jgi:hypothetical protein